MDAQQDADRHGRTGSEERDYLLRRANDHRMIAEKCDEPGTRSIHARLRELYEEQANLITLVLPD